MLNRVKNVGYGDRTPFLNAAASVNPRGEIDQIIDLQVEPRPGCKRCFPE